MSKYDVKDFDINSCMFQKKYYLCCLKSFGKIHRMAKKSFGKIHKMTKKSFGKIF